MKQIIKNKVTCLACNITLTSEHRHDYKTCDCPNHTMIDGGLDYVRYGGVNMDLVKIETEFLSGDFMERRKTITWGSYGREGNQPLRYIPVCEMTNDHLEAVLDNCRPMHYIQECMKQELQYRNDNNIYIVD